jgi:hypothetical protein
METSSVRSPLDRFISFRVSRTDGLCFRPQRSRISPIPPVIVLNVLSRPFDRLRPPLTGVTTADSFPMRQQVNARPHRRSGGHMLIAEDRKQAHQLLRR